MTRFLLLAWVLFSIPLSVALGRLFRSASASRSSSWDPGEVAQMVTRSGFRQHR